MCYWFSGVVTKDGYIHYISREERLRLNKRGEEADHHSKILKEAKLNEFCADKIEYNPLTKNLRLDRSHGSSYAEWNYWKKAWFSKEEILNTLESMPLSEMLPEGVVFNRILYDKLVKDESKLYDRFVYEHQDKIWIGLLGMRKSLYSFYYMKRLFLGLCLTWSWESVRRKNYRQKTLKEIERMIEPSKTKLK